MIKNRAAQIWDQRDETGRMGATACVVVPWFADRYAKTGDWTPLAWWIHDDLPYSNLFVFPELAAFNLSCAKTSYLPSLREQFFH